MKRMTPIRRKYAIRTTIRRLFLTWTCEHGEWSRDKLFGDLERELTRLRRTGSYLDKPSTTEEQPVEAVRKGRKCQSRRNKRN